jgi:hypothetical protein
MAELHVPTVQHLARNWRADPMMIAKILVRLAEHPPIFNYNPLYGAVRDLLILNVPYDQVVEGIKKLKRASVRENLLTVLPLIRDHFAGITPDFFQSIGRRYYPIARGLMVPFEPPMIYGVGGQLYFPWFSFWRQNPLANERLALFIAIVRDVMMQDPDLETARFEILDFSSLGPRQPRVLRIIDASEIPSIDEARKNQMLEGFAEGYFLALEALKGPSKTSRDEQETDASKQDEIQLRLFD